VSRRQLSSLNDPELATQLEALYEGNRLMATGLDLRGRSLDRVDFGSAVLRECRFDRASLRDAILWSSYPTRCSFADADLSGVQLQKSQVHDCDLRGANLTRANLLRSDCHDLDLRNADLSGTDLTRCHMHACDLGGAVMRDVVLSKTSFANCRLGGVDLRGAVGNVHREPIDVGTPEEPRLLSDDAALAWFRDQGADVEWFVPEPRT
jgi:uncharacterized protein YjbI with pentapeptide repeats